MIMSGETPPYMNATGWVVYGSANSTETDLQKTNGVRHFDFLDDMTLIPFDEKQLLSPLDRSITLNMNMHEENGIWQ